MPLTMFSTPIPVAHIGMNSPTPSAWMPGAFTFLNRFFTMITTALTSSLALVRSPPSHVATRTVSYLPPTATTLAAPANSNLSLLLLLLIFACLSGATLVQFRLRRAGPDVDICLSRLGSISTDDLASEGPTLVNVECSKDEFDSPIHKSGIAAAYRDAVVMAVRINQTDDTLVASDIPSSYPRYSNGVARATLSKKCEAPTFYGHDSARPPVWGQPSFTLAGVGNNSTSKPNADEIDGLLPKTGHPTGRKPKDPSPSLTQGDARTQHIPVEPSGVPGSESPYLAEVRRIFETPLDVPLRRRKFENADAPIADSPYQAQVRNIFERAMGENDRHNAFSVGEGPSALHTSANVNKPSAPHSEKRRVPYEAAQARLDELTRSVRSRTKSKVVEDDGDDDKPSGITKNVDIITAQVASDHAPIVSTSPVPVPVPVPSNFAGAVTRHVTEAEEAAQRAARLSQLHDVLETSAAKRPPLLPTDRNERVARWNAIVDQAVRVFTHAAAHRSESVVGAEAASLLVDDPDAPDAAESPPLLEPALPIVSDEEEVGVVYKVPTLSSWIDPPKQPSPAGNARKATHEPPGVVEDVFYTPRTPQRKKTKKGATIGDISFDDEITDMIPGFGVGSPATRRKQRLEDDDYFSTSTPRVNYAHFGGFSTSTPPKGYNNRRDTWADFF